MDKDTALDLALGALEVGWSPTYTGLDAKEMGMKAITAIKQARSAPVQPVAWMHTSGHIQIFHPHWEQVAVDGYTREKGWTPLYTTPQRQWVGLTDKDKLNIEIMGGKSDVMLAEIVEAKLKERNT
jgi:hypothetical protein